MNKQQRLETEAAAWRKLVEHFQKRTDVQNIDLMNQAGFCRNCMAKWYMAGANDQGIDFDYDQARDVVYGMGFEQWKSKFQAPATAEQLAQFEQIRWGEDTTE